MNTLKNLFSLLIITMLFSCEKKEKPPHTGYTIQGYITATPSKEAYLFDDNGNAIDTVAIKDDTFQFLGNSTALQLHEIHFKGLDLTVPVWVQDKNKIYVYTSPTRSFVYGNKIYDAINKYSEKIKKFNNEKLKIISNFKKQDLTIVNNKLDSVSELVFNYTLSEIKTTEKPIQQFLYKQLNINTLNIEKLTKLKETVDTINNKNWLAQITNKIDTLKARALKLDAIVTLDSSKKYVPYRDPAPAFSGASLHGNDISLASVLQGKKAVLVDFWASWCKPCRMLTPQVRAMYNKYHSKGFDIITVSEDRNKASWQQGIAEDNMQAWNHIYDNKMLIASRYGARAIPHMVLIDANGKIIKNKISMSQLERELKKIFK